MDEPDRIRTTISLDAETYATFKALAESAGVSLSRCMGDWLSDTAEAAELATTKMHEIRRRPADVAYQSFTRALAVEGMRLMETPPERQRAGRTAAVPTRARDAGAPSSLTGLNPPTKRARKS